MPPQSQLLDDDRPTEPFEQEVVDRLWVAGALQQLTDEQRRVVELRFLNDLSIAETAERTGTSTMAVKGIQRQALRQLAALVLIGALVLAVAAAVLSSGPGKDLPQIQTGDEFPSITADPDSTDGLSRDDGTGSERVSEDGVSTFEQNVETDGISTDDSDDLAPVLEPGLDEDLTSEGPSEEGVDTSPAAPVEPAPTTSVPEDSAVDTTIPEQQTAANETTTLTSPPATSPATAPPSEIPTPRDAEGRAIPAAPVTTTTTTANAAPPPVDIAATAAAVAAGDLTMDESADGLMFVTISPQAPVPAWATPNVNLLTNGGFESGPYESSVAVEYVDLPSWTTTSDFGVTRTRPTGLQRVDAFEGQRMVELNVRGAPTAISSTVAVTPGERYFFSFRHRGQEVADTAEVLVDGRVLGRVTSLPGDWQFVLVELTAPPDRSSITVGIRAASEGWFGNLVDDVQLRRVN